MGLAPRRGARGCGSSVLWGGGGPVPTWEGHGHTWSCTRFCHAGHDRDLSSEGFRHFPVPPGPSLDQIGRKQLTKNVNEKYHKIPNKMEQSGEHRYFQSKLSALTCQNTALHFKMTCQAEKFQVRPNICSCSLTMMEVDNCQNSNFCKAVFF